MQRAIDLFRDSIMKVRHLGGLYDSLSRMTTAAVDSTDLLRSQIVLSVSAVDFFVHEITVQGMLETLRGIRPSTEAFHKYKLSAGLLLLSPYDLASAFEREIRERHSYLSFQQPDKVADAIRLISPKPLWQELSALLGRNEGELKNQLRLIVERRNQIAHEADVDPSYPAQRWPIRKSDTDDCVQFVCDLCEAINTVVAAPSSGFSSD